MELGFSSAAGRRAVRVTQDHLQHFEHDLLRYGVALTASEKAEIREQAESELTDLCLVRASNDGGGEIAQSLISKRGGSDQPSPAANASAEVKAVEEQASRTQELLKEVAATMPLNPGEIGGLLLGDDIAASPATHSRQSRASGMKRPGEGHDTSSRGISSRGQCSRALKVDAHAVPSESGISTFAATPEPDPPASSPSRCVSSRETDAAIIADTENGAGLLKVEDDEISSQTSDSSASSADSGAPIRSIRSSGRNPEQAGLAISAKASSALAANRSHDVAAAGGPAQVVTPNSTMSLDVSLDDDAEGLIAAMGLDSPLSTSAGANNAESAQQTNERCVYSADDGHRSLGAETGETEDFDGSFPDLSDDEDGPEWQSSVDAKTGETYFFNRFTGETRWAVDGEVNGEVNGEAGGEADVLPAGIRRGGGIAATPIKMQPPLNPFD